LSGLPCFHDKLATDKTVTTTLLAAYSIGEKIAVVSVLDAFKAILGS